MVIILNSIMLAFEDPTIKEKNLIQDTIENIFLGLYTTELLLKVCGLGFLFNNGAYLRDPWNILDFFIVA